MLQSSSSLGLSTRNIQEFTDSVFAHMANGEFRVDLEVNGRPHSLCFELTPRGIREAIRFDIYRHRSWAYEDSECNDVPLVANESLKRVFCWLAARRVVGRSRVC